MTELTRKQMKETLPGIVEKFNSDMYSLCAAIHFLGYPGSTVHDLREFLKTKGKDGLITERQNKFYETQLGQLDRLTETETLCLEFLGEYAINNIDEPVKILLQKLLEE